MRSEYDERSPRTVFETGSLSRVSEEVERLNKKRIVLVSDESAKNWASQVKKQLGELVVQHIDHVVMHVPDEFSTPIVVQSNKLEIDLNKWLYQPGYPPALNDFTTESIN